MPNNKNEPSLFGSPDNETERERIRRLIEEHRTNPPDCSWLKDPPEEQVRDIYGVSRGYRDTLDTLL
jgi:hypothetical protein